MISVEIQERACTRGWQGWPQVGQPSRGHPCKSGYIGLGDHGQLQLLQSADALTVGETCVAASSLGRPFAAPRCSSSPRALLYGSFTCQVTAADLVGETKVLYTLELVTGNQLEPPTLTSSLNIALPENTEGLAWDLTASSSNLGSDTSFEFAVVENDNFFLCT